MEAMAEVEKTLRMLLLRARERRIGIRQRCSWERQAATEEIEEHAMMEGMQREEQGGQQLMIAVTLACLPAGGRLQREALLRPADADREEGRMACDLPASVSVICPPLLIPAADLSCGRAAATR